MNPNPPKCKASEDRKLLFVTREFVAERKHFKGEMKAREDFAHMPDKLREGITKILCAILPEEAAKLDGGPEQLQALYQDEAPDTPCPPSSA